MQTNDKEPSIKQTMNKYVLAIIAFLVILCIVLSFQAGYRYGISKTLELIGDYCVLP